MMISEQLRNAEKDACAIVAFVDKRGRDTHANITQTIDALRKMGHRSGDINGEGDGCGVITDIPRELWAARLAGLNLSPYLAESSRFFVGHLLIPAPLRPQGRTLMAKVMNLFAGFDIDILVDLAGRTHDTELGPLAREDAPLFWQIGGIIPEASPKDSRKSLYRLQLEIEKHVPEIHIASLSVDTVVYKLQGSPDILPRYYPDLRDERMSSVITLGHGRYSTNTLPTVSRSQPFSLLGHNGEINTIERLRNTGRTLGIEPVPGGSDSQDLNRVLDGLVNLYGLDMLEALEMLFPAIYSEVGRYPEELRRVYDFYRWFFPCSAQGPAAIVARHGNVCMGSVDAMGLRPLWFGESDYSYFLSSEKGVVDLEHTRNDPRPLAPGEKIAITGGRGEAAEVLDHADIQKRLVRSFDNRRRTGKYLDAFYPELPVAESPAAETDLHVPDEKTVHRLRDSHCLEAFGWRQYDMLIRRRVAESGREVIGSMGYTGPIAPFVPESLPNISDYCKENVAVVTNPAIDREREAEHFSTRIVLGSRPDIGGERKPRPVGLELNSPLILGARALSGVLSVDQCRELARKYDSCLMEDLLDFFSCRQRDTSFVHFADATFTPGQSLLVRLEELADEIRRNIDTGAVLIVLEDFRTFADDRVFIDPAVLTAFLHEYLIRAGLRRQASLVIQSGAVRNLHDLMLVYGLGADAVNPYMLWQVANEFAGEEQAMTGIDNTLSVLQKGMEKVMSTMGIHEICGYGRIFASIGFKSDLAEIMQIPNFCSSDTGGLDLAALETMAGKRYERATATDEAQVFKEPQRNPKVGRILRSVATGKADFREMSDKLAAVAEDMPTGIRHLLKTRPVSKNKQLKPEQVDISVDRHDMPLVIAAMSFGSQGENSFRTYAEAAKKANIICMNGEGGEIPDMLGKFRHNRGQQIASGRFGVFVNFLNSADYLEIKIGQGAKPGEGGHLPGNKVSPMVAKARHCKPGITLISPSNHHDIYSIEDLAQIITELKTVNPHAKVSVKIPVTTGVGTIAVGVAKAGADILNISGYEGGTGAAREHAKRFVGLPTEVGVSEAHRALMESGLRPEIEIWADGGMRSGDDVLKMILLGANRVGFGTVALMGIGCISCRKCHLDSCPRGISTQIRTVEEAEARGIRAYKPRVIEDEVENLARLLRAVGEELRMRAAGLGVGRLQDLVGRVDLLEQYRMQDRLDAADILAKPVAAGDMETYRQPQIIRKPLNYLTRLISDLAMDRFELGDTVVHFTEDKVHSTDRAVGTYLSGAMARKYGDSKTYRKAVLQLARSVPGNGLSAFTSESLEIFVEGGSQDGAAKGSMGGLLGVFKGTNLYGRNIDGSTGKSFAYGATGGLFMVQNMADSRACVRMSGADVVFGGRISAPVHDVLGNIACRAHLKGVAFVYLTGGRAVVLGDPGPWICAGMTGGVIYQCLYPEYGFDRDSIKRRLSRSAAVTMRAPGKTGLADIRELLEKYIFELKKGFQNGEAEAVEEILTDAKYRFVMIRPKALRPPSAE